MKISAGCSTVGSALRSGRRGRKFESSHPDRIIIAIVFLDNCNYFFVLIITLIQNKFYHKNSCISLPILQQEQADIPLREH